MRTTKLSQVSFAWVKRVRSASLAVIVSGGVVATVLGGATSAHAVDAPAAQSSAFGDILSGFSGMPDTKPADKKVDKKADVKGEPSTASPSSDASSATTPPVSPAVPDASTAGAAASSDKADIVPAPVDASDAEDTQAAPYEAVPSTKDVAEPKNPKESKTGKASKSDKGDKSSKTGKASKQDKDAKSSQEAAVAAGVLTFEQKAREWEAQLDKIDRDMRDAQHAIAAAFTEQREVVRKIRSQAQEDNRIAQEVLDSKTAMLATLGEAPSADMTGPVIPEDKKIISLRKKINDDISMADARVKRSALVLNRAQSVLDKFTAMEQNEIRMMLVTRGDPFYSTDLWTQAMADLSQVSATPEGRALSTWYVFTAFLFSVMLTYIYAPLVTWLNAWNQAVQMQPKRIPFFTAFFGCTMALGMRYDLFHLGIYVALSEWMQAVLVLIISVAFWRILATVTFEDNADNAVEDEDANRRSGGYWQKLCGISRIANMAAFFLCIAGYVNLASYISVNLFLTMMTVAGFICSRRAITVVLKRINQVDKEILSPRHIIVLEPVLLLPFAAIALFFWGVTPEVVRNWLDQYSGGIPIGSIVINPSDLFSAVVMFFSLVMITKLIQWFLGERVMNYAQVEKGVRNTVYSITGYIGYIIAVLTALSTLGINMANLAIVAGALSVGIGFGLQAIFNNFVSGLILLLERPVRVGDWIVVGALEGTVSKIRVRSTEITTFQNASVIIPNSMLITDTVTNWTLNDAMGRIEIRVGVAYDSDVQLVRKLMLKAAQDHSEVRKRPEIKVFFMDFADSSLQFELRCFVKNIDSRLSVMSDLRFRINDAFAKNNIVIPYPQRVVHTYHSQVASTVALDEVAEVTTTATVAEVKKSKKDSDMKKQDVSS
jgi:small-conductance mechanosensitive channel